MRKKYYEDVKENAAFERCADVITSLILKYGPALKQKWDLNEWIRNIGRESIERHSLQKISAVFYLHDEYEKCSYMTKSN